MVHALRRRGRPPPRAKWTVVLADVGPAGGVGYGLYLQARDDVEAIDAGVMQGVDEVIARLVDGPLDLSREQIDDAVDRSREWVLDVLASAAASTRRARAIRAPPPARQDRSVAVTG